MHPCNLYHDQSNAICRLCFSGPQGIFVKDEGALVKTGIFNDLSNFARFIDLAIIIWPKANCLLHKNHFPSLYYSQ